MEDGTIAWTYGRVQAGYFISCCRTVFPPAFMLAALQQDTPPPYYAKLTIN